MVTTIADLMREAASTYGMPIGTGEELERRASDVDAVCEALAALRRMAADPMKSWDSGRVIDAQAVDEIAEEALVMLTGVATTSLPGHCNLCGGMVSNNGVTCTRGCPGDDGRGHVIARDEVATSQVESGTQIVTVNALFELLTAPDLGRYCGYDHDASKCPMSLPCWHHRRNAAIGKDA